MRQCLLFFVFFMILPRSAFADIKRIAVLEFQGVGINEEGLLFSLSDAVRSGLIKELSSDAYLVMTRESTLQVLKDMGKDASCMQGECELEIARNIGSDFVVSGTITPLSGKYLVSLRLYNTSTSALLASDQVQDGDPLTLVNKVGSITQQLLFEGNLISGAQEPRQQSMESGFSNDKKNKWSVNGSGKQHIVSFTSSPSGAYVLSDGKVLCDRTPCKKSLGKGKHRISIQKDRYFPFEKDIFVNKKTDINGALNPNFGYLQVPTTMTGIELLLDGKSIGKTPTKTASHI